MELQVISEVSDILSDIITTGSIKEHSQYYPRLIIEDLLSKVRFCKISLHQRDSKFQGVIYKDFNLNIWPDTLWSDVHTP